jgi:hypothetical protein
MRFFSFAIGVATGPSTMEVTSWAFILISCFLLFFDSSALYEPPIYVFLFFLHVIRCIVQRNISVLHGCHDELGIDLSENHPKGIADKIAPLNVMTPAPFDIQHRRRNGVNSGKSIQGWTCFEAENVRECWRLP